MKWVIGLLVLSMTGCSAVSVLDNKSKGCIVSVNKPVGFTYHSASCDVKVIQLKDKKTEIMSN